MQDLSLHVLLIYGGVTLVVAFIVYRTKSLPNSQKYMLGLFYLALSFFAYDSLREGNNYQRIKQDLALSIGTITTYDVRPMVKGTGGNKIKYYFESNGVTYYNSYKDKRFGNVPSNEPDLTIPYLVIYEYRNPNNNLILLNYPIRNKNDFLTYTVKFRHGIPKETVNE